LTQLYGDQIVIANATGCSSIYGGSVPSTPYSLPWANSLFEDNAEFAYGMHISYKNKREELYKKLLQEKNNENIREILDNYDNYSIVEENALKIDKKSLSEDIKESFDYIKPRTVVAIGGDGWAYDIGFNGIDHILSSGENIKVLVLDTEVYSNTGGQMSKSSHVGQVAEFASTGKKGFKKDLFRIAMSYPNCYVSSICLGANPMQSIKSMKEAFEHQGPAIIIAYSPCIEHGIKGGMGCSLKEQKLAVDSGYVLLMRYNPDNQELNIDSKEPNFDLYDDFLQNEVRYRSLKVKNKDKADFILNINKEASKVRYDYYKDLVKKEGE
jgi:pyruvate-ferredoxin/flavodoxin oxidoreductase